MGKGVSGVWERRRKRPCRKTYVRSEKYGGAEKICIEDYVMTCIHKKEPQEKDGYLGIFYGERRRKEEDGIYLFLRGILELSGHGEPEAVAKGAGGAEGQNIFRTGTLQGCCVIGVHVSD